MSVTIPESFYTSLLAGVGVVQENVIKTFNLVLMISKWTDFFKVQRLITYRVSLRTVSHYVPYLITYRPTLVSIYLAGLILVTATLISGHSSMPGVGL